MEISPSAPIPFAVLATVFALLAVGGLWTYAIKVANPNWSQEPFGQRYLRLLTYTAMAGFYCLSTTQDAFASTKGLAVVLAGVSVICGIVMSFLLLSSARPGDRRT